MTISEPVRKTLLFGALPAVIVIAVVTSGGAFYAQAYNGRILPGVFVGGTDVGGLTHIEAAARLDIAAHNAIKDGLVLTVNGHTETIPIINQGGSDPDLSFDLITWQIDEAVSLAMAAGRSPNPFIATFAPLGIRFVNKTVAFTPTIDKMRLAQAILSAFPEGNHPAVDAGFAFKKTDDVWTVEITPSTDGTAIRTDQVINLIASRFEKELFLPAMLVDLEADKPLMTMALVQEQTAQALEIVNAAPYTLTFKDAYGPHTFLVDQALIADNLLPTRAGLDFKPAFPDALRTLVADVLTPAVDATFTIENGHVQEFHGSRTGVDLDVEETLARLKTIWGQKDTSVELAVTTTEPNIATGEVNNLGISEIIGVGTSNFSGSPTNRVKNIKNGARLLNGTLVKAQETFSLLQKLQPFTLENGYLPELVIKGDKIQPEVGGGLCQIGTTTFRAAMGSGLPIVERRNHSLVVRYYNDPRNGNPGTDATIYDPSPDFKFLNDTGNAILITTDVNTETGALVFTFWGTKDGRLGSYTEPVVSNWIAAGETRNIETLDLEPGKTQCQHAYPGANTSFTYTITRPDGTNEDQIFTSSYRALPEICLVGVEKLTEEPVPVEGETSTDEPVTTNTTGSPAAMTDTSGAPIP